MCFGPGSCSSPRSRTTGRVRPPGRLRTTAVDGRGRSGGNTGHPARIFAAHCRSQLHVSPHQCRCSRNRPNPAELVHGYDPPRHGNDPSGVVLRSSAVSLLREEVEGMARRRMPVDDNRRDLDALASGQRDPSERPQPGALAHHRARPHRPGRGRRLREGPPWNVGHGRPIDKGNDTGTQFRKGPIPDELEPQPIHHRTEVNLDQRLHARAPLSSGQVVAASA